MPDGPPYTAGDEMTCSSDGYPAATYAWTVNASPDSTASTQDLQDGEHTYVCTATVTFNEARHAPRLRPALKLLTVSIKNNIILL